MNITTSGDYSSFKDVLANLGLETNAIFYGVSGGNVDRAWVVLEDGAIGVTSGQFGSPPTIAVFTADFPSAVTVALAGFQVS